MQTIEDQGGEIESIGTENAPVLRIEAIPQEQKFRPIPRIPIINRAEDENGQETP